MDLKIPHHNRNPLRFLEAAQHLISPHFLHHGRHESHLRTSRSSHHHTRYESLSSLHLLLQFKTLIFIPQFFSSAFTSSLAATQISSSTSASQFLSRFFSTFLSDQLRSASDLHRAIFRVIFTLSTSNMSTLIVGARRWATSRDVRREFIATMCSRGGGRSMGLWMNRVGRWERKRRRGWERMSSERRLENTWGKWDKRWYLVSWKERDI